MTDEANMQHIADDTLADYLAGRLRDDREEELEAHLGVCEACTEAARESGAFASLWEGWTARAHGAAYLRAVLATALEEAQQRAESPAWGARLARWRERWAGRAEAAVRAIVAEPGQASRVVTEGLESLARPGGLWQFGPAPAAVPTRGARRLATGSARGAMALAPGASQARVAVSGESGEVVVRVEALPAGQDPPLVLLIPTTEAAGPRLAALARPPGAAYPIARFDNVPPGDYLVALEPLER